MKVAIVGGSLGGLTAACLLRDAGHEVSVYERSPVRLEQRGAGIGFLPETYRYLVNRAKVDLTRISIATHHIRYLNRAGEIVHDAAHNYLFSSWNTVYSSTLQHFGLDEYHLCSEMNSFIQQGRKVTIKFVDRPSVECDLMVAADGISSQSRSNLATGGSSNYSGYVAWRGMIPESSLDPKVVELFGDAITYFVYPHSHILIYPIPDHEGRVTIGDRLINFVWYRNYASGSEFDSLMLDKSGVKRDISIPPGQVSKVNVEQMHFEARRDMPTVIAELICATTEPFVQVIYDLDIDQMVFGRVCLLGDAAIIARPHAAAGTAKAAADGWALVEALSTHAEVDDALNSYQTKQLAVGKNLLARTRRVGEKSQFLNSWDPNDPEVIFGLHKPGN